MPDIPTEILREIFAYFSSPLQVAQAYQFPWHLGQVCSQWRALFISMRSTFWRKIEIDRRYNPFLGLTPSPKRITTIVTFFLNRTQGAPFSFSFFHPHGYEEYEKKHMRGILKDLLDCSRQWEEVSIPVQLEDLNLLRGAKGHLPLLKRLDITLDYGWDMVPHPSFTIFEDAPLLTHVAVGGISTWEFNWSSLTNLDIGYQGNIAGSLHILQKTVNLVELAIGDLVYEGHVAIGGLIHLPHLKYLSIRGDGLLTVLKTPALRRLEIGGLQDTSSFVKAHVAADFFHRSLLKLTLAEKGRSESYVLLHTSTI